ncbi:MAG: oxidoreductase, partial [Betaproteobacteria bacterium]
IGVGSRDLDERVGGLGMLAAIDALDADALTRTLVLISKPPAPRVAREVLERVRRSAKRTVVCFLGSEEPTLARTLTQAAETAIGRKLDHTPVALRKVHGAVRGLYCGGTLAAEAALILRDAGAPGECVDLGDDRYTRGRPHPMIEPELRNEHIVRAAADPAVGVLLFDVMLGYGAHADPAGVLIAALKGAQKPAIASVTGTEQDPQRWSLQVAALRAAGVHVTPSNAHAAMLAASVVS